MKVLVGASVDRILGFTMIGAEAGEVVAVVQTAMVADLPYPKLRDAILAHPTMAEGLGDLFANVPASLRPVGHTRPRSRRTPTGPKPSWSVPLFNTLRGGRCDGRQIRWPVG